MSSTSAAANFLKLTELQSIAHLDDAEFMPTAGGWLKCSSLRCRTGGLVRASITYALRTMATWLTGMMTTCQVCGHWPFLPHLRRFLTLNHVNSDAPEMRMFGLKEIGLDGGGNLGRRIQRWAQVGSNPADTSDGSRRVTRDLQSEDFSSFFLLLTGGRGYRTWRESDIPPERPLRSSIGCAIETVLTKSSGRCPFTLKFREAAMFSVKRISFFHEPPLKSWPNTRHTFTLPAGNQNAAQHVTSTAPPLPIWLNWTPTFEDGAKLLSGYKFLWGRQKAPTNIATKWFERHGPKVATISAPFAGGSMCTPTQWQERITLMQYSKRDCQPAAWFNEQVRRPFRCE